MFRLALLQARGGRDEAIEVEDADASVVGSTVRGGLI